MIKLFQSVSNYIQKRVSKKGTVLFRQLYSDLSFLDLTNISLNAVQQFQVHHGSSNSACFYYKEQNKKGLKHLAFGVKLFQCYVLRLKNIPEEVELNVSERLSKTTSKLRFLGSQ